MKIIEMLRTQLAELSEKRDGYLVEIEAITELATAEKRSQLNDLEEQAFAAAEAALKASDDEVAAIEERIKELEKIEERISSAASRSHTRSPKFSESDEDFDPMDRRVGGHEVIARAKTFVEKSHYFSRSTNGFSAGEGVVEKLEGMDEGIALATAQLVLAGGTKEYVRAWCRAMTGTPLDSDDARAVHKMQSVQRALNIGSSAAGGYGIPTMLDPTLILTAAQHTSPIRQLARQESLSYENQWRGLSSGGITASWDTEASEVSDDSPTFAQPTVDTVLARAFVPFSVEISEDFPNLLSDLAMMFAEAKTYLEDIAFVSGNGSTAPMGILTTIAAVTAMRVAPTTGGSFGYPDIYKTRNALPTRYRNGNSGRRAYLLNNGVIDLIRLFPTAVGVAGFISEIGNGQPSRLLGDQMIETSPMTSTITTGNCVMVFGDFSRYLIVNKVGVQTELIPHLFHTANNLPSGQRGIYMRWRVGGKVIDNNAFIGLTL